MYLYKDQYLNDYKRDLKDDKETYAFLLESFPSLSITPNRGSYLSSELCLFAYLCYCFSPYELSSFLGNFFSGASVRTRLNELRSKQKGVLTSLKFAHSDMGAQKAFSVSKQGYVSYLSLIPDSIKSSKGQLMVRRSSGLVPAHDYGIGLSLLSFLTLGVPFYYEKEEVYSLRNVYKQKGSVCVDCTLYLTEHDGYRIYLEQDMGNETTLTLVNKIAAYKHLGLTSNNSCIIFSSHAMMDTPSCSSFMVESLESIYQDMLHQGVDGAYEYLTEYGSSLDSKTLTVLKALLVRTGVCLAYADTSALERQRTLCPEEVTNASILRRNVVVDYIMKMDVGTSPAPDFSIEELRRYTEDLRAGSNPYRMREYNRAQDHVAKNKFYNMCAMLCRMIDKGLYSRDEIVCLLYGYSCYMVPSVLLGNASHLYLPHVSLLAKYERILLPYYPTISSASYSEWSNPISYDEYVPIVMRHAYTLESGKMVVLEHIGKDIGAFVRCYYLKQLASVFPNMDIHVVCICDTDEDMVRFCEMANYTVRYSRFPERSGFYMSFLIETELDDTYGLLKGIDELGNPPIYIRTKEQSDALSEYLKNPHDFIGISDGSNTGALEKESALRQQDYPSNDKCHTNTNMGAVDDSVDMTEELYENMDLAQLFNLK